LGARAGFAVAAVIALFVNTVGVGAQDHQHEPATGDEHAGHQGHDDHPIHDGHEASSHGLYDSREGSGTSWLPDITTMYGRHIETGSWEWMLHGTAFLQYLNEFAPVHRGSHQFGSINWVMAMARRPLGGGRFTTHTMLSLEPWTIAGCGYPDLLASGELCEGDGLHDKQHPHDLFMEVAVSYEHPAGNGLSWLIYGGPSGEPALGPPAFPHRLSAVSNPIAPISHHWLDATHISYGVVTGALSGRLWRIEASAFNGREPDEDRTDFDVAPLDSFSGRFSLRPRPSLALQVSAGRLESAEQDFAGGARYDIARVTASALYERHMASNRRFSGTLAWGVNGERGQWTHAGLAEGSLSFAERDVVFGRAELNAKPSHALHIHEQPGAILTVAKLQGGYTRYGSARTGLQLGLGATVSAALVPPSIQPNYGGVGLGFGVFLALRPAAH